MPRPFRYIAADIALCMALYMALTPALPHRRNNVFIGFLWITIQSIQTFFKLIQTFLKHFLLMLKGLGV
jgi:hypothetical protein